MNKTATKWNSNKFYLKLENKNICSENDFKMVAPLPKRVTWPENKLVAVQPRGNLSATAFQLIKKYSVPRNDYNSRYRTKFNLRLARVSGSSAGTDGWETRLLITTTSQVSSWKLQLRFSYNFHTTFRRFHCFKVNVHTARRCCVLGMNCWANECLRNVSTFAFWQFRYKFV